MKKLAALLGLGSVSCASFAQEAPAAASFDLSAAGDAATTISTNVSNLIKGDVLTGALLVLSALVVLWVIFKIPRWVGIGRK